MRKTKEQKLKAELRRLQGKLGQNQTSADGQSFTMATSTVDFKVPTTPVIVHQANKQQESIFVISDLKKIVTLTLLAFFLEAVLFVLMENRLLSL
ncbi:hypothetical protein HY388_00320 [Candidatus Daviesbacteria bacterium]|nr:hypothetical protein [Candidatus Levybacteria bacterium]MBI4039258.1 hypothetical protein [Candidatus Daviesbacteria bacterium]